MIPYYVNLYNTTKKYCDYKLLDLNIRIMQQSEAKIECMHQHLNTHKRNR